jgi:hypothetical protein
MMKRLLLVVCLVLAGVGGATLGSGHATALAAGNGEGNANACAKHAANNGNSYGYGLDCATLTATITGKYPPPLGGCALVVTGTDLQPGSGLFFTDPGVPTETPLSDSSFTPITVAADGTVNQTTFFGNVGGTWTLYATTESGTTITATYVPSC